MVPFLLLCSLLLPACLGLHPRNATGRRLVKRRKVLGANERVGYVGEVEDYGGLEEHAFYTYQEAAEEHGERQTDIGFLDFLTGTKLTNMLTLSLPIPLCDMSDLCKEQPLLAFLALLAHLTRVAAGSSVDVALPFTVLQLFPATGRSERRVEEEQAGLYTWAEGILERWVGEEEENSLPRYGLPGQPCVLRGVCELAAAGGLQGQVATCSPLTPPPLPPTPPPPPGAGGAGLAGAPTDGVCGGGGGPGGLPQRQGPGQVRGRLPLRLLLPPPPLLPHLPGRHGQHNRHADRGRPAPGPALAIHSVRPQGPTCLLLSFP